MLFKEKKRAWLIMLVLWFYGLITTATRFVTNYYQSTIAGDYEVLRGFVSMTWAVGLLIGAIFTPVGGMLADKYGVKKVLAASCLFGSLGSFLVLLVPGPPGFFIGFGLVSGLIGIGATAVYKLVFQWFHVHRGKAVTIISSAAPLGLAIFSPIFAGSGWLTWQLAFLITAAIGIVVVFPSILWMVKEDRHEDDAYAKTAAKSTEATPAKLAMFAHTVKTYASSPVMLTVILALFVCGFSMGTVEMHIVAIHEHAHVDTAMIASAISVLGLLEIAGSFLFGYLLDRMNRMVALGILYLFRTIGFVILLFQLQAFPFVFSILFGATYIGAVPGSLLVAGEFGKQSAAQTGVLLLFHQAGAMMGSFLGGVSFDLFRHYDGLIVMNAALSLVVTGAYFMVGLSGKKRVNQPITASGSGG